MPELLQKGPASFTREQYRALLEVAEAIAARRDLHEVFHDLAQCLPRIVPFDFISLLLHDPTRSVVRLHVLMAPETSKIRAGVELPVDETPGGLVWRTQEPLIVENLALESRFPNLLPQLGESGVQSLCVVPLTTALRRLGAMGFGSTGQQRAYQEAEVTFMQQVARQVAVAVDNVLHDESAQDARRQLTRERDRICLLLEVNNAVVSQLSLDDLFPAVSACLRTVIEHDGSALVLYEPETRRYRVHVLSFAKNESFIKEGITDSGCQMPASSAINTRQPELLGERDLHRRAPESACARHWVAEGMKAFCAVPLVFGDRVLGALDVGRRREDMFSPEEVELLGEVAKQIAIAVENAQAYRQISELKDRLAKENLYLEEEARTDHNFGEIVGDSAALRRVLKEVETVAPTGSTVLIRGETGTGKELVARALHDLSPRRERTFVKLTALPFPPGCSKASCSAMRKALSPVPSWLKSAASSWQDNLRERRARLERAGALPMVAKGPCLISPSRMIQPGARVFLSAVQSAFSRSAKVASERKLGFPGNGLIVIQRSGLTSRSTALTLFCKATSKAESHLGAGTVAATPGFPVRRRSAGLKGPLRRVKHSFLTPSPLRCLHHGILIGTKWRGERQTARIGSCPVSWT
jgi:transcriptional regulator with GAF, ATPase, and Fis domain